MTEYNKETLAQTIVYIAVGLVAFFTIIAAIGYGVYCFIKNYYPKKENK